jgi:hypothetical protein
MKKTIYLIILFCIASILLSSCIEFPEEPKEYLPWCKDQYKNILEESPNLPPSFIGYCMAFLRTGEELGVERFCGFMVEEGEYSSIQECVADLKTFE